MVCFRLRDGRVAWSVIKSLGLGSYQTFFRSVDSGNSVEQACVDCITSIKRRRNIPRTFYNGVPISEIFGTNSSKYVQVMTDIRNGKSIEDAVRDATVKKCKHCGEYHQRKYSDFCCEECRYMGITKEVECSWCGKLFRVRNQQATKRRKYGIFCSQHCSNEARRYINAYKRTHGTYNFKYGTSKKNRHI